MRLLLTFAGILACTLAMGQDVDYIKLRPGIVSTDIDNIKDNGFRPVTYTGEGQHASSLLTYSPNSSTGTLQLEAMYWGELRFRNCVDGATWNPWKTFWTSENLKPAEYLKSKVSIWNLDAAGYARIYFGDATYPSGGTTYLRGYGDVPLEVRSGADATIFQISNAGEAGIGGAYAAGHKLAVRGSMIAEKVKVKQQSAWPDYVFSPSYPLPSLASLEAYITEHRHLPGIPKAAEVAEQGQDLGEMNRKLLEKVEELTLYLIEQDKEMKRVKERLKVLEGR